MFRLIVFEVVSGGRGGRMGAKLREFYYACVCGKFSGDGGVGVGDDCFGGRPECEGSEGCATSISFVSLMRSCCCGSMGEEGRWWW